MRMKDLRAVLLDMRTECDGMEFNRSLTIQQGVEVLHRRVISSG